MNALRAFSAIVLAAALLIFAGCNGSQSSTPQAAASAGPTSHTLVVASEASFPPMEFTDDSGAIVGFDIDLIRAVAKEAHLEIEIRNVAWDGIFGALKSGSADIIASSITITDDRKAQFDLTRPYLRAGQVILVRTDDRSRLPELAALKGKKIGVQIATTGAEFVQKQAAAGEVKQYNTAGLAIIDLANGNVDAVVIDKPVADYYTKKKPEFAEKLAVVGQPQTTEQFGFAIRKGETELLTKLDAALARLEQNGTLQQIENKWFR